MHRLCIALETNGEVPVCTSQIQPLLLMGGKFLSHRETGLWCWCFYVFGFPPWAACAESWKYPGSPSRAPPSHPRRVPTPAAQRWRLSTSSLPGSHILDKQCTCDQCAPYPWHEHHEIPLQCYLGGRDAAPHHWSLSTLSVLLWWLVFPVPSGFQKAVLARQSSAPSCSLLKSVTAIDTAKLVKSTLLVNAVLEECFQSSFCVIIIWTVTLLTEIKTLLN